MDFADAYKRQVWTAHHWQHWLARGQFPDHLARLSAAKRPHPQGLTYAPTGAIAAAGTTSLPETRRERNYDYRFTWIRDATFALWGLYSLGFDWEAVDFFAFIADLVEGEDDIQIMYGIGGEKELTERELDHLPGYARLASGADRERRVCAEAARCLGRAARLGLPSLQGSQPLGQPYLGDLGQAGRRGVEVLA